MAKKKSRKQPEPQQEALSPKHELFCQYYTRPGEFFGNATLAYAEAYDYKLDTLSQADEYVDEGELTDEEFLEDQPHGGALRRRRYIDSPYERAKNVCAVEAHRLLRMPKIQARCRKLLNELMQDEVVDAERIKVIMQDEDLGSKMKGIISFDKLRGRIIDKTQQVNTLPFGQGDLSAVIATLPQERQDYYYGVITNLIEEADKLRGGDSAPQVGFTR